MRMRDLCGMGRRYLEPSVLIASSLDEAV